MFRGMLVLTIALTPCTVLAVKPTPKPKPCLPEGKHTNDPGRCCSKSMNGNICCGVTHGSCANSGCCDPIGDTPHCYQESCVACLPEGAQGDASSCCDHTAVNGICCGTAFGSCADSGCCAESTTLFCYEGICVPCLPDGAPVTNGDETVCCSGAVNDAGQCCGEVGAICAASLCCAAGAECDGQTCQPCLEEGHQVTDPSDCCSGTAPNGVCCGLLNETCANSGCCILGVCSDTVCVECLPEGQDSSDPNLCCSHEASNGVCCGEENGFCLGSGCCAADQSCFQFHCSACTLAGGECTSQSDCCEGDCCNGVCIPTDADPANCGGCGNLCAEICCNSQCLPQCPEGEFFDPDTCACCHLPGASCGGDGDCCFGACCNSVCTDTQSDPLNCGSCAHPCSIPNTCQNGRCGHQCLWGFPETLCSPPANPLPFCSPFETCVSFCQSPPGSTDSYVICCGTSDCAGLEPRTCGDGTCCCGGCDLITHTCCGVVRDSCLSDSDCCPGLVCDEVFGGCNIPN